MYGIITYIYHTNQPNVGTYTIHGSYGLLNHHLGVPNRRELVAMKLAQILPFKKTPTRGNQAPKLDSESTPPTKPSLVRVTSTSKYLPVQVRWWWWWWWWWWCCCWWRNPTITTRMGKKTLYSKWDELPISTGLPDFWTINSRYCTLILRCLRHT